MSTLGFLDTVKEIGVGAVDAAEFIGGEVPVVGSIVHGGQAAYDLGAGGIDAIMGDDRARHEHIANMEINAAEAIPLVGTALGAGQVVNDLQNGEDHTTEQVERANGYDPEAADVSTEDYDANNPPADETKSTAFKVMDTLFGWAS
jgi:hypothetical protein